MSDDDAAAADSCEEEDSDIILGKEPTLIGERLLVRALLFVTWLHLLHHIHLVITMEHQLACDSVPEQDVPA